MIYEACKSNLQDGRELLIRSAGKEDAESLVSYLKKTAGETPYLIREPEEIKITKEQEEAFLEARSNSEGEVMLVAFVDGKHVGNCSISKSMPRYRYRHRCSIAIALLQEYWGLGIGKRLFEAGIQFAKEQGYEQIELEVHAENQRAITMYKSFGFTIYGTLEHDMKYRDGSYSACHMMVKYL